MVHLEKNLVFIYFNTNKQKHKCGEKTCYFTKTEISTIFKKILIDYF